MKSFAQAYQDLFVLIAMNKLHGGSYLDVGSFDPKEGNNTYLLDREFQWSGTSMDRQDFGHGSSGRRGDFVIHDATKPFPRMQVEGHIDYLSLDVDEDTNMALLRALDYANYAVITIEHDVYARGEDQRDWQRGALQDRGYILQVSDVHMPNHPELVFEDWWCSEPWAFTSMTDGIHDAKETVEKLWKERFGEEELV